MIIAASSYTTETEPFRSLMQKGHDYVKAGKLLDFSISQMQPWLDVKDGYSSVVAIGEDAEVAEQIAKELADGLWNMRHEFKTDLTGVDEIIKIAEKNESGKPVIMNDFADSSNAGSAGDSPEVIERIIALESDVRALMYLNDAPFVAACHKAGVGNKVKAVAAEIPEALERLLDFVEQPSFLSVYCGADAVDAMTAKIEEILKNKLPDAELTVLDGGQPLYDYVIAVE